MERAGKLNRQLNGGSMTFLPIADTLAQDVTGFIPSNLISMTDGQIYLSTSLFAAGIKPAVDLAMSVSIIGTKTQDPVLRQLSSTIRLEYAQYRELLRLTKLKSRVSHEVDRKIRRGEAITAMFAQDKNNPVGVLELIVLLYALNRKILDDLKLDEINRFKKEIWGYVAANSPELVKKLEVSRELSAETFKELDNLFVKFMKDKPA